jgi:hypothetical protein
MVYGLLMRIRSSLKVLTASCGDPLIIFSAVRFVLKLFPATSALVHRLIPSHKKTERLAGRIRSVWCTSEFLTLRAID